MCSWIREMKYGNCKGVFKLSVCIPFKPEFISVCLCLTCGDISGFVTHSNRLSFIGIFSMVDLKDRDAFVDFIRICPLLMGPGMCTGYTF